MDRSNTTSPETAGKPGAVTPLRYPLGSEAIGHAVPPKKPRLPRLTVRHKVSGTNRRARSA